MFLRAALAIGFVTYLAAHAEHGTATSSVAPPAYGERLALAFCQESPSTCVNLAMEATRGLRRVGGQAAEVAPHRPADALDRLAAAKTGPARRPRQVGSAPVN